MQTKKKKMNATLSIIIFLLVNDSSRTHYIIINNGGLVQCDRSLKLKKIQFKQEISRCKIGKPTNISEDFVAALFNNLHLQLT